jgi:DNA-binding MarR family transcriptional regulator
MAPERVVVIEEIVEAHQNVSRAIGAVFGSVWMELDLSMAQLKTLLVLSNGGALPIGQIAEILSVGQPTASHLVDRLVQSQLVIRSEDPVDRRRTLAQLSPQGTALAERLVQMRREPLQRWLAQLDEEFLAALCQSLQALVAIAKAEASPVPETT